MEQMLQQTTPCQACQRRQGLESFDFDFAGMLKVFVPFRTIAPSLGEIIYEVMPQKQQACGEWCRQKNDKS